MPGLRQNKLARLATRLTNVGRRDDDACMMVAVMVPSYLTCPSTRPDRFYGSSVEGGGTFSCSWISFPDLWYSASTVYSLPPSAWTSLAKKGEERLGFTTLKMGVLSRKTSLEDSGARAPLRLAQISVWSVRPAPRHENIDMHAECPRGRATTHNIQTKIDSERTQGAVEA